MTARIPTLEGTAFWRQRTALDGADYFLDFAWNARDGKWFLSVFDADEVPLALSIAMVSNRPLLRRHQWDPRLPPGEIVVFDPTGTIDSADYAQLIDMRVLYLDAAELGRV